MPDQIVGGAEHPFIQSLRPTVTLGADASTPGIQAALDLLSTTGATPNTLSDIVRQADGPPGLQRWAWTLTGLFRRAALRFHLRQGETDQAILTPVSPRFRPSSYTLPNDAQLLLSRFVHTHRVGNALRLESPLAHARIDLYDPTISSTLSVLSSGCDWQTIQQSYPGLIPLIHFLGMAGMVTHAPPGGVSAEDQDTNLLAWEYHDLLFHGRSRQGRHDGVVGGSFHAADRSEPGPVAKSGTGTPISLPRRPPSQVTPTFFHTLDLRRSMRAHGSLPITLDALGAFLDESCRIRHTQWVDDDPHRYEVSTRPYPSGGATYPLEIYPVVQQCQGLAQGAYHYDARAHLLTRVPDPWPQVVSAVEATILASGTTPEWNVLLVITARFARTMWKYQSLAYALILKEVGALYQTMYLTATAMGLAPCAMGTGDADRWATLLGTSLETESSVGEFLLGSPGEQTSPTA